MKQIYIKNHTIYKRQEIIKKWTRNIKRRKKKMGVATRSFMSYSIHWNTSNKYICQIQSRDIIRSSCSAYILRMQSTR